MLMEPPKAPSPNHPSAAADNGVKKSKAPVRRNPDARREQNRIASRIYRQKRKQKLSLLDQLLVDGDQNQPGPSTGPETPDSSSCPPSDHAGGTVAIAAANPAESRIPAFTDLLLTYALRQTDLVLRGRKLASRITDHGWTVDDASIPTPDAKNPPAFDVGGADDPAVAAVFEQICNLTPDQRMDLMGRLGREMVPSSGGSAAGHRSVCSSSDVVWVPYHLRPGDPETRMRHEIISYAHLVERQLHLVRPPVPLEMTFARDAAFFGAIYANSYAIGMPTIDEMVMDEGVSPFSISQYEGHHPSQLALARARFENITPDLLPSDVQLTLGHHPYLDIIPFREFRDNTITAIRLGDCDVDEYELCHDLLLGGLIFWGAQGGNLDMSARVPWDHRSWEPQLWFLKKYHRLVGGWDGAMWTAARRWHEARGEVVEV